jgi:DNA-binding NarL/FixJ family response regulator
VHAVTLQNDGMEGRLTATRVLVVEDVPELARLLEMTFELDGRFEPIGTATSGGAALDIAARERPDAIVLDVTIHGVDGIGVLPALRRVVPEARIIVFTGHDDAQLREQAMKAGASAWVLKGGDLGRLLDELSPAQPAADES